MWRYVGIYGITLDCPSRNLWGYALWIWVEWQPGAKYAGASTVVV
jgi:hypothetical protein